MAVLALTVFATISATLIIPPLLVEIASDLEISVAVAGQLATATFAGWAIMVVSGGPLSDSFGRRPVALVGLTVLSISVLASAFAPSVEILLVSRVLTGLAGGAIRPNIVGAVSDVISPARRARAVSALLAIQGLASAISVPLVTVLADVGGWRFAFIVYGLVLAAGLLANWFWLPKDRRGRVRNRAFFSRYRSLVSMRFFRVAVAVNLTQRIAFWGTISFFAAYLINTYSLSIGFVALPLAIAATGQMFGSYSAASVANRRHRAAFLAATTAAGGSLRFPVLHRKSRTLGVGSRGNGCNGLAERYVSGSGLGQHRVFGRIQGHGSGSYGFQQPDRWGPGRRDRRSIVGDYGLCGNRLHVPRRYDSQRADDEPLRPPVRGICRAKQRVDRRHVKVIW